MIDNRVYLRKFNPFIDKVKGFIKEYMDINYGGIDESRELSSINNFPYDKCGDAAIIDNFIQYYYLCSNSCVACFDKDNHLTLWFKVNLGHFMVLNEDKTDLKCLFEPYNGDIQYKYFNIDDDTCNLNVLNMVYYDNLLMDFIIDKFNEIDDDNIFKGLNEAYKEAIAYLLNHDEELFSINGDIIFNFKHADNLNLLSIDTNKDDDCLLFDLDKFNYITFDGRNDLIDFVIKNELVNDKDSFYNLMRLYNFFEYNLLYQYTKDEIDAFLTNRINDIINEYNVSKYEFLGK